MALQQIVQETVTGLGYDLVEIDRTAGGLLRITIDFPWQPGSELFINVEDCEKVNRQLQFALEVDGVAYNRLEVSSPGIDRPLTREKDFANWAGHEVRIVMDKSFDGQRVNKGVLGGLEDGMILVKEVKAGDVRLPLSEIHTAKLVLTDALIAATRPLDTSGADELIEDTEKADD